MSQNRLTILHVDMDAFYASIEQRDRPELRGKPVLVGGRADQRGVVSAASYEARPFGVHSAMPMVTAQRLCPQAIILPVRMKHYAQVSRQVREIFLSITPLVEPLSLDEAFLDVQGCEGLFGPAPEIGRKIKERILEETGLIASVGVACNKFLAKLASDYGKPDGFVVVETDKVPEFLDPLSVSRLWGVGTKAAQRLQQLGLRTIGEIAALSEKLLVAQLGDFGRHLWRLANGIDERVVTPDGKAKSLSAETTFAKDISDRFALFSCLLGLVEHLSQPLRAHQLRARTIELKVRTSDFRTYIRSQTLEEATDLTEVIRQTATALLDQRVPDRWLPLRLLGVGAIGLTREVTVQGDLFDDGWRNRQHSLDQTIDAIRQQFGDKAIRRAGTMVDKANPNE